MWKTSLRHEHVRQSEESSTHLAGGEDQVKVKQKDNFQLLKWYSPFKNISEVLNGQRIFFSTQKAAESQDEQINKRPSPTPANIGNQ